MCCAVLHCWLLILHAAAREVLQNHVAMTATGTHLDENPFWYFVMENAPNALYSGYKSTLYGLVSHDRHRRQLALPAACTAGCHSAPTRSCCVCQ
jgi:hypothetical protein